VLNEKPKPIRVQAPFTSLDRVEQVTPINQMKMQNMGLNSLTFLKNRQSDAQSIYDRERCRTRTAKSREF